MMKLTIDVPDTLRQSLERQLGPDLSQAAKETLAVTWYRSERISIGQVAELLGISVYEAEGLLKKNNVSAPYLLEDYDRDRETLGRALK